ncbi:hypothetical protein KC19_6G226300 [Ceratodon purpureus]|uniref:Uncharacterized protein n=1 Tax=Ceratodon purpureus TaxID=3225 RepID=A0A8T0HKE8_CERPU|nr:hypothetical protein KC19_6G226300 [Ceratodon purpureus]
MHYKWDEQRRRGFGPGRGSRGASISSFSGVLLCFCQLQFGFVLPKVQSGAGNRSLSSLLSRAPCAAWLVKEAANDGSQSRPHPCSRRRSRA